MLINCPRCGFSQPKDQYCASCGINMETFVPQKVSLIKRLLSSTLLQVFLVVGITLGVSYYALKNRYDDSSFTPRRKQSISGFVSQPNLTANEESSTVGTENSSDTDATKSTENTKSDRVELALQNEDQQNTLAGSASVQQSGARTAPAKVVTIKYSFYEIDRQLFNYWIQLNPSSAQSDQSGNYRAGLVNAEILEKQLQIEPLKTETKKSGVGVLLFNAGVSAVGGNPEQFIGLTSEISLRVISDTNFQGSLNITRKNSQGMESINVPLLISSQNAFFIHWRNDLFGFDPESPIINVPPFQILRSPRFVEKQTDLVIILEPNF